MYPTALIRGYNTESVVKFGICLLLLATAGFLQWLFFLLGLVSRNTDLHQSSDG